MINYRSITHYGRGTSKASISVYGLIGAALLGLALYSAGSAPTLIRFAAGAFLWTLIEYLLHRFSFHSTLRHAPGRAVHSDHHAFATSPEHIGAPVVLSLPLYTLLIAVFWVVSQNLPFAFALSAGLATAYVGYERFHFWTHHGNPRTRLGRYLKRYHMGHHFKDSRRSFGVTSPLWDWVFGTLPM